MSFEKKSCCSVLLVLFFSVFLLLPMSYADPIFYYSTGGNPGADLNGDVAFQSSVSGYTFVEENFDSYSVTYSSTLGGYYGSVGPTLTYGNVDVTLSLSNGKTPNVYRGWWDIGAGVGGGLYGAVSGLALDSSFATSYTFSFSGTDITKGFGIWIFDDGTYASDFFSMTVEGLSGNTWTSGPIDANSGLNNHAIEGFIGANLDEGIRSITINNTSSGSFGVFELDHMQIASTAPAPEPATMLLFGLGLLGVAGVSRKKSL